jgi:hypothetical protein
MKTKPREDILPNTTHEITMPYRLNVYNHGYNHAHPDDSESRIMVTILIYDDARRYGNDGHGISQRAHIRQSMVTEKVTLNDAIKLAKMAAVLEMARQYNPDGAIYICIPKNLGRFLNDGIVATGNDFEQNAYGKLTVVETRIY